jgi:tetratricopeptide (TPR) repeat protein
MKEVQVMLARIVFIMVTIGILGGLLPPPLITQSKNDQERLLHEGLQLSDQALSKEDLQKAAAEYQEALNIYRRNGDGIREAQTLKELGNVYYLLEKFDEAELHYEKALKRAREIAHPATTGRALNNLGAICKHRKQYSKAAELYKESLAIAIQIADTRLQTIVLNNLGQNYSESGQYAMAVEHFKKLLKLAKTTDNRGEETIALKSLGQMYYRLQRYSEAAVNYEEMLRVARRNHNVRGEFDALTGLGNVSQATLKSLEAIRYRQRSLEIAKNLGDNSLLCIAFGNLGIAFYDMGGYADSTDHLERALELARKIPDAHKVMILLSELGLVHHARAQYAEAVKFFKESSSMAESIRSDLGAANALGNLGVVHRKLGRYSEAGDCYKKSLDFRRKTGDRRGEIIDLNNLGFLYATIGEREKAMPYYEKAVAVCLEIGVPAHAIRRNMAELYLDGGDLEKAEPLVAELDHYALSGRYSILKGDLSAARDQYERLLQWTLRHRSAENMFIAYTGLALSHELQNANEDAARWYREAVDLVEKMRSSVRPTDRAEFYHTREGGFLRTAPYEGLARVLFNLNRPLEAFKVSEYSKARVFAESMSMRGKHSHRNVPAKTIEQDSKLNEQLAKVSGRLQKAYEKDSRDSIALLESQVNQLKALLTDHVKALRKDYPIFAATKYPLPMDLKESYLKDDERALVYDVTDNGVLIYLTKGKELIKAVFKPIGRKELDELVFAFMEPLNQALAISGDADKRQKSFDLAAGKRLSNILLEDVLPKMPEHVSLIVIPDDALGVLPFEMLVLNDEGVVGTNKELAYVTGAEYFGDRNLISYCHSITSLTLSRIHAESRRPRTKMLLIADPVYELEDDRVERSPQKETPTGGLAQILAEIFRGFTQGQDGKRMGGINFTRLKRTGDLVGALEELRRNSLTVCTGFDAAKDNFLLNIRPTLDQYDTVIFATHGYFGKDLPGIMEPVLVLTLVPPGTDGYLRMSDVMDLKMNADIVALTACQSGLGKRTAGEGTMGMGRAFQYVGARSVLMSLWSVSQYTSVELVTSFFRNMKNGKGKVEALAAARTELRQRGFDHPFFWAPFILVGETK